MSIPRMCKLYNIEASPSALPPGLPEDLIEYGMEVMRRKGVQYKLSTAIKECTPEGVILGNGEFIRAGTDCLVGRHSREFLVTASGI